MTKITAYTALTSPAASDVLPVVDISDTSMAASGTTKKITIANLLPVDWLNAVTQFGADPGGTADSTTALGNAASAAASAGTPLYIPAGTYKTTGTLDWRLTALNVIGAGKHNSKIVQFTDNTQIVRLAGNHQKITGLQFKYNAQQAAANTSAIAVSFGDDTVGSCFESIYDDLYIINAQTGMAIDPAVATVGGLISCTLRSIQVNQNGGQSGINMFASNGTGSDMTGNHWEAIYVSNNWNGSVSTWGGTPVSFQGCDNDHFSVINVEHGNASNSDIIRFTLCQTIAVDDLHIEAVAVAGTPGFGFVFASTSTVSIRGMHVRSQTLTGTTQNPVIRFASASAGSRISVDGYSQPTATGISTAHPWVDFNSATSSAVRIRNVTSTQVTGNQVGGSTGDKLVIGDPPPFIDAAPAAAIAETFPRLQATTAAAPATGTLVVRLISLAAGMPVTSATLVTNSAGKTGGTHGWYVLLDQARKVLAVTADQTDAATVWGTANTPYTLNFGAAFTPAYDGYYYLGVMVAATGMPNFAAAASPAGGINGTLTPILAATSSTGQTTPPALAATMTGLTSVAGDNLYAYVS